jgi:hypothetical protein
VTSRWLLPVRACGCCHLDVTVRSTYGAGGARAEAAQVLGGRPAQPPVGRADRLDGVCVGLWLADGASRLWKRPHGPTAIVASEQETVTNGHSHDGDQAQRPGHHQEPPEHARERRESRIGSHFHQASKKKPGFPSPILKTTTGLPPAAFGSRVTGYYAFSPPARRRWLVYIPPALRWLVVRPRWEDPWVHFK